MLPGARGGPELGLQAVSSVQWVHWAAGDQGGPKRDFRGADGLCRFQRGLHQPVQSSPVCPLPSDHRAPGLQSRVGALQPGVAKWAPAYSR